MNIYDAKSVLNLWNTSKVHTIELTDLHPSYNGMSVREMYWYMGRYKELMLALGASENAITDGLVRWKHKLRKKIRENTERQEGKKIIRNLGDTWIELIRLGKFNSSFEADDYFMLHDYMECIPSQYDCTGQIFTNWYHIFKRNGEYWAYHSKSIDV